LSGPALAWNNADGDAALIAAAQTKLGCESRATVRILGDRDSGNGIKDGALAGRLIPDNDKLWPLYPIEHGGPQMVDDIQNAKLMLA
jgi:hypothetical protein